MKFWQRVKEWLAAASLRSVGGIDLPSDGRSSVETNLSGSLAGFNSLYGAVSPVIDFEMLKTLKNLWLYNPDFSQYVDNIVNLGNPGHQLIVQARSTAQAESVTRRLNVAAAHLYPSGGVDGLINQYLTQLAWSGAISSEDVVDLRGRSVKKVVLVPVEQIRFSYDEKSDEYLPHQTAYGYAAPGANHGNLSNLGLLPLNTNTYRYCPLQTVDNSPYAKPPATAAVEAILDVQKPILENVKYIAKKLGILGLITALVTKPQRKPAETEEEYQKRAAVYLSRVRESLDGNFNKGLVVAYRDFAFDHTSVNASAQGTYDINRMSEEQVMSGFGMQPAFFGRTDSTTETYADVVYNLLLAKKDNFQRVVKRRHERTLLLDTRLAGIEVDSISVFFNKAHARNPLQEAQAEQIHQQIIFDDARNGMISPDEAARKRGYEKAFDPSILGDVPQRSNNTARQSQIINLTFKKETGRYEFAPEQLSIADCGLRDADLENQSPNVIPLKKKAQRA